MNKNTKKTTTTKRKAIKQKKKQQKYMGETIYFEVVLMIILIPTTVLFLVPIFQKPIFQKNYKQSRQIVYKTDNKNSVRVATEKSVYKVGGEMVLSIKNNSDNSIYFEPCEYLNNFEKKVDDVWIKEENITKNKIYDSDSFKKGESVTSCKVDLSELSAGTYRSVVKIYYDCQAPGESACSNSKVFYSNEFKVINN